MEVEDVDIYEDLPQFELDKECERLQNEIVDLHEKTKSFISKIDELMKEKKKLAEQNRILQKNISILLKTAKQELQRKDTQIVELRGELEKLQSTRGKKNVCQIKNKERDSDKIRIDSKEDLPPNPIRAGLTKEIKQPQTKDQHSDLIREGREPKIIKKLFELSNTKEDARVAYKGDERDRLGRRVEDRRRSREERDLRSESWYGREGRRFGHPRYPDRHSRERSEQDKHRPHWQKLKRVENLPKRGDYKRDRWGSNHHSRSRSRSRSGSPHFSGKRRRSRSQSPLSAFRHKRSRSSSSNLSRNHSQSGSPVRSLPVSRGQSPRAQSPLVGDSHQPASPTKDSSDRSGDNGNIKNITEKKLAAQEPNLPNTIDNPDKKHGKTDGVEQQSYISSDRNEYPCPKTDDRLSPVLSDPYQTPQEELVEREDGEMSESDSFEDALEEPINKDWRLSFRNYRPKQSSVKTLFSMRMEQRLKRENEKEKEAELTNSDSKIDCIQIKTTDIIPLHVVENESKVAEPETQLKPQKKEDKENKVDLNEPSKLEDGELTDESSDLVKKEAAGNVKGNCNTLKTNSIITYSPFKQNYKLIELSPLPQSKINILEYHQNLLKEKTEPVAIKQEPSVLFSVEQPRKPLSAADILTEEIETPDTVKELVKVSEPQSKTELKELTKTTAGFDLTTYRIPKKKTNQKDDTTKSKVISKKNPVLSKKVITKDEKGNNEISTSLSTAKKIKAKCEKSGSEKSHRKEQPKEDVEVNKSKTKTVGKSPTKQNQPIVPKTAADEKTSPQKGTSNIARRSIPEKKSNVGKCINGELTEVAPILMDCLAVVIDSPDEKYSDSFGTSERKILPVEKNAQTKSDVEEKDMAEPKVQTEIAVGPKKKAEDAVKISLNKQKSPPSNLAEPHLVSSQVTSGQTALLETETSDWTKKKQSVSPAKNTKENCDIANFEIFKSVNMSTSSSSIEKSLESVGSSRIHNDLHLSDSPEEVEVEEEGNMSEATTEESSDSDSDSAASDIMDII